MKTKVVITLVVLGFLLFLGAEVTGRNDPALWAGGYRIRLELADTESERMRGLGKRETTGDDEGMLFVFPKSDRHGIWMKDMQFPLDIVWLKDAETNADCARLPAEATSAQAGNFAKEKQCLIVVDLKEHVFPDTYPEVFLPKENASYVLEMKGGGAGKAGINLGSVLTLKR